MSDEPHKFESRQARAAAEIEAKKENSRWRKRKQNKVAAPIANDGQAPKSKKRHLVRNIILTVLALLSVSAGAFAAKVYDNTKNAAAGAYDSAGISKLRNVSAVLEAGEPFSILLMGTDTGELGRDYKGRTDSMMLVTVNPKKKTTTIMSLPRDQVTSIVGYEDSFPQKLNAAYTYGSAGTAIKTVEAWLNVPIDYYALVNMGALETIVNQLGGVEVTSPLTFSYDPDTAHETGANYFTFTEGSTEYKHYKDYQLVKTSSVMDGETALAFSRMRYTDPKGDYGRQQRQRLVLEALVNKAKGSPLTLVNKKFMTTISDNVKTDLTFNDMLTIVSKYTSAGGKIVSDNAQGSSVAIDGASYEFVSPTEQQRVTDKLRKALGLEAADTGSSFGGEVSSSLISYYGLTADVNGTTAQ
jgi:LCP family protein required for cell wall assembly